jgi:hypothetical protein
MPTVDESVEEFFPTATSGPVGFRLFPAIPSGAANNFRLAQG